MLVLEDTENVENVWSQSRPTCVAFKILIRMLRECQVKTLSGQASGFLGGNVVSLNPVFTPYGSIKTIKFVGDRGTRELKGEAVRNVLGLRSTLHHHRRPIWFAIVRSWLGSWSRNEPMGAYNLARQGVTSRFWRIIIEALAWPEFKCSAR